MLRDIAGVDRLLRVITRHPELAALVRVLTILPDIAESASKAKVVSDATMLRKLAARRQRCTSLKTLIIWPSISHSSTFPYECVFGTSLSRFGCRFYRPDLHEPQLMVSSDQNPPITRYISYLPHLQDLSLLVYHDDLSRFVAFPDIDVLLQNILVWTRETILPSAELCPSLRRISVRVRGKRETPRRRQSLRGLFRGDGRISELFDRLPALKRRHEPAVAGRGASGSLCSWMSWTGIGSRIRIASTRTLRQSSPNVARQEAASRSPVHLDQLYGTSLCISLGAFRHRGKPCAPYCSACSCRPTILREITEKIVDDSQRRSSVVPSLSLAPRSRIPRSR
ncbi:hypothetical protein FKP32DRAFT_539529 [Trametes sanguinea]|nr:hypothetical protein FKP32DRAFT_539529 [Trametes sanguinea]